MNYAAVASSKTEITFLSNDTSYSNEPEALKKQLTCATGCIPVFITVMLQLDVDETDASPMLHDKGDKSQEIN